MRRFLLHKKLGTATNGGPLTIRILRFHTAVPGFRGETIIVATTLLDPKAYPFEEIAGLYRDRWIVELRLRDIKTTLGMDILRGKSADVVRKEIYMHLLVYNLIRVLMWQASETHHRPLHRLSFAGTLHGVDDCAITGSIPNLTEGSFSVFAWVKGDAPGQAVLSQMGGARWLCADPLEGNLMTELKGTGRDANELLSQTVITDGNWHRIGLVWDGSNRTLYVDDVAVAEDMQTDLEGSENGLYIGAGTSMEDKSFWSGLIDDVRIYNRAVSP